MIVYPDTNIYFRPFDDWSNQRIALEADACLWFWRKVEEKKMQAIDSALIHVEADKTPKIKYNQAERLLTFIKTKVIFTPDIKKLALSIEDKLSLPPYDALHVSFAAHGGADVMLTCDDDILKKSFFIEALCRARGCNLTIANPVQFRDHYLSFF